MSESKAVLFSKYVDEIKKIDPKHLKYIVGYGDYAQGEVKKEADIDIMVLLDLPARKIKEYRKTLYTITAEFNHRNDTDIKVSALNMENFLSWILNHPFFANIENEGVVLYGAA